VLGLVTLVRGLAFSQLTYRLRRLHVFDAT